MFLKGMWISGWVFRLSASIDQERTGLCCACGMIMRFIWDMPAYKYFFVFQFDFSGDRCLATDSDELNAVRIDSMHDCLLHTDLL